MAAVKRKVWETLQLYWHQSTFARGESEILLTPRSKMSSWPLFQLWHWLKITSTVVCSGSANQLFSLCQPVLAWFTRALGLLKLLFCVVQSQLWSTEIQYSRALGPELGHFRETPGLMEPGNDFGIKFVTFLGLRLTNALNQGLISSQINVWWVYTHFYVKLASFAYYRPNWARQPSPGSFMMHVRSAGVKPSLPQRKFCSRPHEFDHQLIELFRFAVHKCPAVRGLSADPIFTS